MIALCQVIHHQARGIVVGTVTMALLEKLAIVTDKYACANAVSFASRPWLEQYDNDLGEDKLVTISYLLELILERTGAVERDPMEIEIRTPFSKI